MASQHQSQLPRSKKASVIYHAQYNYPLTSSEIEKWQMSSKQAQVILSQSEESHTVILEAKPIGSGKLIYKKGYWTTNEADIKKRINRKQISDNKLNIASKRAKIISLIPTVEFVGVTGSLAMKNARFSDDLDLFIVVSPNTLWATRALVYALLMVFRVPFRRRGESNEKDKLCLNMWLASNELVWPKSERNLYTSHELAQIIPLVNKHNTYEQLLAKNKWILDYWPHSVSLRSTSRGKPNLHYPHYTLLTTIIDPLLYWIQKAYMRGKITREVVERNKALFHPIKRYE